MSETQAAVFFFTILICASCITAKLSKIGKTLDRLYHQRERHHERHIDKLVERFREELASIDEKHYYEQWQNYRKWVDYLDGKGDPPPYV